MLSVGSFSRDQFCQGMHFYFLIFLTGTSLWKSTLAKFSRRLCATCTDYEAQMSNLGENRQLESSCPACYEGHMNYNVCHAVSDLDTLVGWQWHSSVSAMIVHVLFMEWLYMCCSQNDCTCAVYIVWHVTSVWDSLLVYAFSSVVLRIENHWVVSCDAFAFFHRRWRLW